jgi:hypothetical protein
LTLPLRGDGVTRSVRATGIRMTSESQLREKLRKIEALFVGAGR